MEHTFSHLDAQGNVTMVDVGDKAPSKRVAIAEAVVELAPATLELLKKSARPRATCWPAPKSAALWRPNAPAS